MRQLFLKFPIKAEYLNDDFYLSEANEQAYNYLTCWPNWPNGVFDKILLIYGEQGCGKTHLAHIWHKQASARFIHRLDYEDFSGQPLILEAIDNFAPEPLLHLINAAHENGVYLLLTASCAPSKLKFQLADLNSRLLAINSLAIKSPEQDLLKAILFKSLSERDLELHPAVLDYLSNRIDRSFSKLFAFIELIEQECKTHKRMVTIPLVKNILAKI